MRLVHRLQQVLFRARHARRMLAKDTRHGFTRRLVDFLTANVTIHSSSLLLSDMTG